MDKEIYLAIAKFRGKVMDIKKWEGDHIFQIFMLNTLYYVIRLSADVIAFQASAFISVITFN